MDGYERMSFVGNIDLKKTEHQYGDVLVLLAVYMLMDINKEKGTGFSKNNEISQLER